MSEHWEFIVGLLAVGMTVWSQLKTWTAWFRGLFIRRSWTDITTVSNVAAFLASKRETPAIEAVYSTHRYHVRPLDRHAYVSREHRTFGKRRMWHKRRPIWITKDKDAPNSEYQYRIDTIRFTLDVEALIVEANDWCNRTDANDYNSKVTRHSITYHHGVSLGAELAEQKTQKIQLEENYGSAYRFLGWRNTDVGSKIHARNLTSLSLPPNLERLAELMRKWVNAKNWYTNRGIPHRRGFLLHGIPGTGKTSFVRALAEEHDLPVHVMDLATMSNSELRKAWSASVQDAPCVILIEDIDAVFRGRENVSTSGGLGSSGGLTFDALLNCIDGVERHDGIVTMVTTNHIQNVDPALTERPGRIDHVVEFLPLGPNERYEIAKRVLGDPGLARLLTDSHPDCTAAAFVDVCCRKALETLFNDDGRSPEKGTVEVEQLKRVAGIKLK